MDPQPGLEDLVAALRADVSSGAAQLARKAAEVLQAAALRLPAASRKDFDSELASAARQVVRAQPAMAPMVALARTVLQAAAEATDLDEARAAATDAARRFADDVEVRRDRAVQNTVGLVPHEGTVLTVSSSSTVRAALLHGNRAGSLRVICLEARPLLEGREMAADLARHGVPVTVAVDAAASSLVPQCACVLSGADSIGDLGVVNKIGTWAVAEAARRAGVPLHVVADETKILPPGFPQYLADDRPAGEVWRAPQGIHVWNRYFEALPLALVTTVVTDAGAFTPGAVETRRRDLPLPDAMRSWIRAPSEEGSTRGAGVVDSRERSTPPR